MKQSITVAIVTRNRAKDLRECLKSLSGQTLLPERVLIVDNDSSDSTTDVIKTFSGNFPLCVVTEKTIGYPAVYNRALQEVKTTWVVFIDDDCVAQKQWFYEMSRAIKKHKTCGAILGQSQNYYRKNMFACAFQFWYEYWRQRSIQKNKVIDYRCLDSRNIAYNRQLLIKRKIRFDNALHAGAEDSDLGLQIQENKLQATYANRAVIFHKEPRTVKEYFRKKHAYAKAERYLMKKWKMRATPLAKHLKLALMVKHFRSTTKHLSLPLAIGATCLIVLDYILSRWRLYSFVKRG